jgi:membrane protease YdiL (CAAX protease family)
MPPAPTSSELALLAILAAVAVAIVVGHYALGPARFAAAGPEHAVHRSRLARGSLYGLLPLSVAVAVGKDPLALGLALPRPGLAGAAILAMGTVMGLVVVLASRGPRFRDHHPAIRDVAWTTDVVRRNLVSWSVYLLGYELLFRGVLLFSLVDVIGVWPAIGVQTLAYAWQHLPKNGDETAATLPVGALFGVVAVAGAGIWAPLVLHIVVANLADLLAGRSRARA